MMMPVETQITFKVNVEPNALLISFLIHVILRVIFCANIFHCVKIVRWSC